jgi:hypothetical protein
MCNEHLDGSYAAGFRPIHLACNAVVSYRTYCAILTLCASEARHDRLKADLTSLIWETRSILGMVA